MTSETRRRLFNVLWWIRTAKENLPAINDGIISSERIVRVSALLDRLHHTVYHSIERDLAVHHRRHAA